MPSPTTTRIAARFQDLRAKNAKGLVVYLTAGDPNLDATGELLVALDRAGVDVSSWECPFRPAGRRAGRFNGLGAGAALGRQLRKILERSPAWPESGASAHYSLQLFQPDPAMRTGEFCRPCRAGGSGRRLVVDLAVEEADGYIQAMRAHNVDTYFWHRLPPPMRAWRVRHGFLRDFLFHLAHGRTGERSEIASSGRLLTERARRVTSLPLAMGFGISTAAQVREVQSHADAAVVGSAVVHAIEERFAREGAAAIEKFVRVCEPGRRVDRHE